MSHKAEGTTFDLRSQLLAATERVLREKGIAGITVREIAREAGVADGTLYNYFRDKEDLLVELMFRRMSEFESRFRELTGKAGNGTVAGNLETLAQAVLDLEGEARPFIGSLISEPKLRSRLAERFHTVKGGLNAAFGSVSEYLRQEQKLGRVDRRVDPEMAAMLLVGTLHDLLFRRNMLGHGHGEKIDPGTLGKMIRTLVEGLAPRG